MSSRAKFLNVFSNLVLFTIAILTLANCATPAKTRATMPLTPPPIVPQFARVDPNASQPTREITPTGVVTGSAVLSSTPVPSTTTTLPVAPVVIPTIALVILPTVTPTGSAAFTLPTPTPTPIGTPNRSTTVPSVILIPISPTVEGIGEEIVQSPGETTTEPTLPPSIEATDTPTSTKTSIELPSALVTFSVPLPASYQAQGSFASQTVYTDSTIAQQQGTFTIIQSVAANAYGANQHYSLRTQRAIGILEEINVYQIDEYILVNYTGSDWTLVRRDQGSNIVRAIQPISDLAVLFPRTIDQAEFIGQEEVAGIPSFRYRMDDPSGQAARLIQPLLALSGEIRSLKLEVWIAVPGGYAVAYNFQVELANARVLNADGRETRADQAVTWTYQLRPNVEPQPILWPDDAPTPSAFPVPGFLLGEFPLPPNTELLALVGGVPDLTSTLSMAEIDSFYRTELFNLGWTVTGEGGLLRCNKEGASFQLLITEDATTNGTRISILPQP